MLFLSVLALVMTAEAPAPAAPAKNDIAAQQQAVVGTKPGAHPSKAAHHPPTTDASKLSSNEDQQRLSRDRDDRTYQLAARGLLVNALYLLATIGILIAALLANRHGRVRHEQTLDAVKQQLTITRDSNDIARAAYVTANRAIIDIGTIGDPNSRPITLDDGEKHTIPIDFKNIGRLPALDVQPFLQVAIQELLPETLGFRVPKALSAPTVIGPGSSREMFAVIPALSKTDAEAIVSGKLNIFLWGQATYDDFFGNQRLTQFCFRCDPATCQWSDVGQHHHMT